MEADRGEEGTRWLLDDPAAVGSTEVWVQRRPDNTAVLHTFVRVDRRGRPWPGWWSPVLARRLRFRMSTVLWRFKDELDRPGSASGPSRPVVGPAGPVTPAG